MQSLIAAGWLPEYLSLYTLFGLVALAGLTSFITAFIGIGGGAILLAGLSLLIPTAAIIPVHGLVQLGSNANRAAMTWRWINWQTITWFAPGVLLGAGLASMLLVELPVAVLQTAIALFILYLCWGPSLSALILGKAGTLVAAALTTLLSHLVGATGPLVGAFVKQQQASRQVTVATFAAAMTLQHAPKALVFGLAGFAFKQWLLLVLAMIAAGALGTKLGLGRLQKISDQRFNRLFNILLTLIAARLLWQALLH